jgi:RND family efflux transporter MFP subunit
MRRTIWIVLTGIAAGAVVFALLYWRLDPTASESAQKGSEQYALKGLIVTAEPNERRFAQRIPWTGIVQSTSAVELAALTAGRIESVSATDQSPVQAGTTVMTLGGSLLASRKATLQANITSAQAQLALAEQTVQSLKQDVAQQLATTRDLAVAQAQQVKLEAQLGDAQLQMRLLDDQTHVTAPISGVFTERRVSKGQSVKEGDVLGAIIDPNHLRIVASLFPPERVRIEGAQVEVRLNSGRTFSAGIRAVLPQASGTGATQVWIEGPQIDEQLRAGQTVAGDVTVEVRTSLAVPRSAIVYGPQEQPYAFVQEQGRYERRSVRLGLTQDGWVEVLGGLEKGQAVVTEGAYELLHREFSSQFQVED